MSLNPDPPDEDDGLLPSDRPPPRLPSEMNNGLPSDRRPSPWADMLPSDRRRVIVLPSDLMTPTRRR
jgi:hypothetical protein